MDAIDSLRSRLAAGEVTILDGGMGSEVQRRGVASGQMAWSAEALITSPETVRAVHEDYIRAGAEIITTNTFSTGRADLTRADLGERTAELNRLAVRLAREARDNVPPDRPVLIAGSMSTFIPKNDGTVTPSYEAMLAGYGEQSQLLAEAGVDLILVEMLVRTLDARAAVEASAATGFPVWVGFSCREDDGELRLGAGSGARGKPGNERVADAARMVNEGRVEVAFIMHTFPHETDRSLPGLKANVSVPVGAFAHTIGSTGPPNWSWDWDKAMQPEEYLRHARSWVGMGAQIIGGCCGTTPDHIRALKDGLPRRIPT